MNINIPENINIKVSNDTDYYIKVQNSSNSNLYKEQRNKSSDKPYLTYNNNKVQDKDIWKPSPWEHLDLVNAGNISHSSENEN